MSSMTAPNHTIKVFIENEAGSSIKNTYDEKTLELIGSAEVARPYPYPYGFVLDTLSGDGDCVDCFVVTEKALRSGDMVACSPVHLLQQHEDGEIDHKILCVLAGDPGVVADSALTTIRAFITSVFSHIPGKRMQLGSLLDAAEAVRYVRESRVAMVTRDTGEQQDLD
jgi:inorganic pyrophosphatase